MQTVPTQVALNHPSLHLSLISLHQRRLLVLVGARTKMWLEQLLQAAAREGGGSGSPSLRVAADDEEPMDLRAQTQAP